MTQMATAQEMRWTALFTGPDPATLYADAHDLL